MLDRLARSRFRRLQRLISADADYLRQRGIETVLAHAERFLRERLAPAHPPNDGKQTPMRGHPAFVAQHATATCCRGCSRSGTASPADGPSPMPRSTMPSG